MKEVIINLFNELKEYQSDKIYFKIVQIGCGGNGGYLIQQMTQMLSLTNFNGEYVLVDPDIVEEKNLRNQLFIKKDIGLSKAEVLAKRYRAAYQIPISFYDKTFIESEQMLDFIFEVEDNIRSNNKVVFPILIGCVDNGFSRNIFHDYFMKVDNLLYIDVGIDAAQIPKGKTLDDFRLWTDDEKKTFSQTGYVGQVVAGLKLQGEMILDPVGELYPNILEDDDGAPSEAACSTLVSSDPQRLATNRMAAMATSLYFYELFYNGVLKNHYTTFHSRKGYLRSEPITINE